MCQHYVNHTPYFFHSPSSPGIALATELDSKFYLADLAFEQPCKWRGALIAEYRSPVRALLPSSVFTHLSRAGSKLLATA